MNSPVFRQSMLNIGQTADAFWIKPPGTTTETDEDGGRRKRRQTKMETVEDEDRLTLGNSERKRRYPNIKGWNSCASQKILWEQVVTCSAHSNSKEHFRTNLFEYWGRGVHGRSSYLPAYLLSCDP